MSHRNVVYVYEPTERWLAYHNPITKQQILQWYKRSAALLEKRRTSDVRVRIETVTVEFDRDSGKEIKRGEPEISFITKWKISEQDYLVYLAGIQKRFLELKDQCNKRILARK